MAKEIRNRFYKYLLGSLVFIAFCIGIGAAIVALIPEPLKWILYVLLCLCYGIFSFLIFRSYIRLGKNIHGLKQTV